MKLVVNMVMGNMMCALGEGLQLCQASDLPADADGGLLKVLDLGIVARREATLDGVEVDDKHRRTASSSSRAPKC